MSGELGTSKFVLKTFAKICSRTSLNSHEGEIVWVYALIDGDNTGDPKLRSFPPGRVYLAEDGSGFTIWIHENDLESIPQP